MGSTSTSPSDDSPQVARSWSFPWRSTSTLTTDDSSQVLDMAFVIVDVDLIVDPER
jgi:hypothetical protein